MNLHKLGIIIRREYLNKVKKKSFLIITFLAPILFAGICILPSIIMYATKEEARQIGVIDRSGIVLPYLESSETIEYKTLPLDTDVDAIKNDLKSEGLDVLLVVSELDTEARTVTAGCYSSKPLGLETGQAIENRINKAVEDYRIDSYNIEGLENILKDVKSNVKLTTYTIDKAGKETISESGVYMAISMILGMAIYMFIAMFCGMVMTSVIEEKSSRVVEVLVSSVKSTELMFGKIIGVAMVALTQFLLWILLTGMIIGIVGGIWGFGNILGGSGAADPSAVVSSMGVPEGMDLGALTDIAGTAAVTDTASVAAPAAPTGMQAIMSTLGNLNFARIGIAFLLYFIFGYLLYASLFAAIGSAVENEADTQQLQLPVTVPLMLGFFVALYAFKAPDSSLVFWCSMIPFTSPIVMLARIPFGVPLWELILSVAILIGTFAACAWASAKIYHVGILMYGKKSSFKDLWKWLKQK